MASSNQGGKSNRGFASMDPQRQREIASQGGPTPAFEVRPVQLEPGYTAILAGHDGDAAALAAFASMPHGSPLS